MLRRLSLLAAALCLLSTQAYGSDLKAEAKAFVERLPYVPEYELSERCRQILTDHGITEMDNAVMP